MKLRRPRILCVDDEPLNLTLLEAMLSPRGYETVRAENGPKALETLRAEPIDLCLLDVMMPGMDGFELCRRIKAEQEEKNIPVIMITSCVGQKERICGIEAGAEDFITKPFDAAEVLARIKMLLHVKGLNDRLNSAYHNIAKLSAFGEQIMINFDPVHFDFLEKIDSIVDQISDRSDRSGSPGIVIIGMLDQTGASQWRRYEPIAREERGGRVVSLAFDHQQAFSSSDQPLAIFYNQEERKAPLPPLVSLIEKEEILVTNLVQYATDSFCLIALNYGREVTIHDATVLSSVVMQSLFLRSLATQVKDTESAFEYTVLALARASEANDEETGDHILRVGTYCALLARQLKMSDQFVYSIRIQAALHDVGKIHISPAILKSPEKLTASQWQEMKMHTLHGSKIIGGHQRMSMAARIAISHHERYDGSGYPYGLAGEKIPIEGRILGLADQYDALRHARSYKPALDHDTSWRIITQGDERTQPHHFDPMVINAFKASASRFSDAYDQSQWGGGKRFRAEIPVD